MANQLAKKPLFFCKKVPENRQKALNSGNLKLHYFKETKLDLEAQLFTDQIGRDLRWTKFLQLELGQLYQAIPFTELEKLFPVTDKGRPALMLIRGGIALQVLKSYLGLSDAKLIERVNTDWVLQFFCGIRLPHGKWIKDKDYVGRWRRFLAKHIDYDVFQQTLAQHWKPVMNNTHAVMMDATCYESHLRYPTDVKLLWESW